MTGEEQAIDLVRQCWLSRPLSVEEKYCLNNLQELSRGKSPTLSLLCHDIERSSNEYLFLHNPCSDAAAVPNYYSSDFLPMFLPTKPHYNTLQVPDCY